ncbi:MAG: preprotein translocase subunit SecE [Lachnospiraceae bacterium]|jgi:preprotein translocase subunit SecE|nr:preprotein translocase subunit SecE [Lachnospiraceae bacterium]
MAENTAKKNVFQRLKDFFKGLKTELKKITWPTLAQTVKQTIVVVVISIVLCLFIRLIDVLSQYAVSAMSTIVK